jgi:hypothetical protein
VWCSFKQISREADISYNTLLSIRDALIQKGYIREIGRRNTLTDHRIEYCLQGLLNALTNTIKCDPQSNWAKANGKSLVMSDFFYSIEDGIRKPYEAFSRFTTAKEVNEWILKNRPHMAPPWDGGSVVPLPKPISKPVRLVDCANCGVGFETSSPNALYCSSCRKARRVKSLRKLANKGKV